MFKSLKIMIAVLSILLLSSCDSGNSRSKASVGGYSSSASSSSASSSSTSSTSSSGIVYEPIYLFSLSGGDGSVSGVFYSDENAVSHTIYYSTTSIAKKYPNYDGAMTYNATSRRFKITGLENDIELFVVVAAKYEDGISGPGNQLSVTPTEIPKLEKVGTRLLNDTGQDWCADSHFNQLPCPQSGHPNQDGEIGRDYLAKIGQLEKVGAGHAGFDFTKIGALGESLEKSATEWGCVLDNRTRLMWEVKTKTGDFQDFNHSFAWYQPDPKFNGGFEGYPDGGYCTEIECNTYAYVNEINQRNLCGYEDWRLPTRMELLNIMSFDRSAPAIDTDYFPHNVPPNTFSFHWTSVSNISGREVWYVHSNSGATGFRSKASLGRIRLVRAME